MEEKNSMDNASCRIKDIIEKLGIDYSSLSPSTVSMLKKIDAIVDQLICKEEENKKNQSRIYASINNISKLTGISNKTFQNNRVLKSFLEYRQKDFNKVDQSLIIKDLKSDNSQLQTFVDILIKKDLECEPLRIRIRELEEENRELQALVVKLQNSSPIKTIKPLQANINTRLEDIGKIISWNVNGYRQRKYEIERIVEIENPDIICLQEIKNIDPDEISGYYKYIHPGEKKGQSGVAIYSKYAPIKVTNFNSEGRIITAEFSDFVLINVYSPTIGQDHKRANYREEFDISLYAILSKINKPSILCGDFNVISAKQDASINNASLPGQTEKEVMLFHKILGLGYHDSYRELFPSSIMYTWNNELRYDYFLTKNCKYFYSDKIPFGTSDHEPIILYIKESDYGINDYS